AKCVLVVREDDDGLRRYMHIGTGNYNSKTARLYEDLGLLTSDPEIGSDLGELFNHLTGFSREEGYRKLLVAPDHLRGQMVELIRNESRYGAHGRITLKQNSLTDAGMVEALYGASVAGVAIDMIVRGICCLRPGVANMSETVLVRSILGRYLEHSRVFRFANGAGPGRPLHLIGSADLMGRNLDRRVEVLVPVTAPENQRRIDEVLDELLAPDAIAWMLDAEGVWTRRGDTDVPGDGAGGKVRERLVGVPRRTAAPASRTRQQP